MKKIVFRDIKNKDHKKALKRMIEKEGYKVNESNSLVYHFDRRDLNKEVKQSWK
jgi:DNA polymerase III delta prime subunit